MRTEQVHICIQVVGLNSEMSRSVNGIYSFNNSYIKDLQVEFRQSLHFDLRIISWLSNHVSVMLIYCKLVVMSIITLICLLMYLCTRYDSIRRMIA